MKLLTGPLSKLFTDPVSLPDDPMFILFVGIATVIGMIIVLRVNAFLALITAAIVVSLMAPGAIDEKISRVAGAFGDAAGKIGIVIGLAAIIGKCMMDSGAADRVVRAFLNALGEKRAPVALMGSGFVLAVPVFFDTVFYLLVPLARSLWKKTKRNYLLYVLAISAGGAITHTLVPPTPGPLTMAAYLKIDLGVMILIGALVAIPAACAGLLFSVMIDRISPLPMREIGNEPEPDPLKDEELPPLWLSLLPVLLPVIMIATNTVTKTIAERTPVAVQQANVQVAAADNAQAAAADEGQPGQQLPFIHRLAKVTACLGDANFALLLSAAIAMITVYYKRQLTLVELGKTVEIALMSGGVIILITAAGGAFGAMLKTAEIGKAIENEFQSDGQMTGFALMFLGFGLAALLKIAQGSSTVAMITASTMLAAVVSSAPDGIGFDPVYLATAIGAGSLVGSWMNDSGFWIFAKMSGLTEAEALKTWTPLLLVMAVTAMATTLVLATVLPSPTALFG